MIIDANLTCMAQIIQHEAGNQSMAGKEAVAQVVLNRARDGRSYCQVARQRGQFPRFPWGNRTPSAAHYQIAWRAHMGQIRNRIGSRLFFNTVGPKRAMRIGNHLFW